MKFKVDDRVMIKPEMVMMIKNPSLRMGCWSGKIYTISVIDEINKCYYFRGCVDMKIEEKFLKFVPKKMLVEIENMFKYKN